MVLTLQQQWKDHSSVLYSVALGYFLTYCQEKGEE